ncbi:MAG: hypothetical protein ACM3KR_06710 [Deltaproteobacteria bacterium]
MENEEFKNEVNNEKNEEVIKKDAVYLTKGQKVTDFFIGFFGGILYSIAMIFAIGIFSQPPLINFINIFFIAVIIVYIGLIIYFTAFNKRKYIGIGLLGYIILILISFGGCFFATNLIFINPNQMP